MIPKHENRRLLGSVEAPNLGNILLCFPADFSKSLHRLIGLPCSQACLPIGNPFET